MVSKYCALYQQTCREIEKGEGYLSRIEEILKANADNTAIREIYASTVKGIDVLRIEVE